VSCSEAQTGVAHKRAATRTVNPIDVNFLFFIGFSPFVDMHKECARCGGKGFSAWVKSLSSPYYFYYYKFDAKPSLFFNHLFLKENLIKEDRAAQVHGGQNPPVLSGDQIIVAINMKKI
jgi:hypothetical protein